MKRALITGVTGQDGRYLGEHLVSEGYQVYGLVHGQNHPKAELVQAENPALEHVDGRAEDECEEGGDDDPRDDPGQPLERVERDDGGEHQPDGCGDGPDRDGLAHAVRHGTRA